MLCFGVGFFFLKNNPDSDLDCQTRLLPSAEFVTKTVILKVKKKKKKRGNCIKLKNKL